MKIFKHISVLFIVLFTIFSFGQSEKNQKEINKALRGADIKTQFEVLVNRSPEYQKFHNIKFFNLSKFKSNFLDTLKAFDKKYSIANSKISEQRTEIDKLNAQISAINKDLTSVTQEKDSINLFGIQTTKSAYNISLWSIILGLLATTLIFLFRFRSSNKQTKEAKTLFKDVEEEFESHKKKSLEREQVLRRKLQDEINKQRNS